MLCVLFAQRIRVVPRHIPSGGSSGYDIGYILGIIFVVCLVLFLGGMLWRYLATTSWDLPSPPRRKRRKEPRRQRRDERARERGSAGPAVAREQVEPKLRATHDLLRMLGQRDPWFEPAYLKEVSEDVFALFQECWDVRDFARLRERLTAECHGRFLARYDDPEKRGILPRWHLADLERLQLVRFSARGPKDQHGFTVLVTGRDEDWLQEFWTFQRAPQGWQLSRIQSANATASLSDPNEVPPDLLRALDADPAAADLLAFVRRALSDL